MNILLAAATEAEIAPFTSYLQQSWNKQGAFTYRKDAHTIHVCITGVGMMAAIYQLSKALQQSYDFALQAGIAGAFNTSLRLADVVAVSSEQYGDLGAEDHAEYLDIFSLGFVDPHKYPFMSGKLVNTSVLPFEITLPIVSGLSVNTVSGCSKTIERRTQMFHCDIESMEGIAFQYACLDAGMPFLQVRSISNYVEPRDKDKWRIKEAINSLNDWLIQQVIHKMLDVIC